MDHLKLLHAQRSKLELLCLRKIMIGVRTQALIALRVNLSFAIWSEVASYIEDEVTIQAEKQSGT